MILRNDSAYFHTNFTFHFEPMWFLFSDYIKSLNLYNHNNIAICSNENEYYNKYTHLLNSDLNSPCTNPIIINSIRNAKNISFYLSYKEYRRKIPFNIFVLSNKPIINWWSWIFRFKSRNSQADPVLLVLFRTNSGGYNSW